MAAILSPSAKQQFFDDAGNPAAGFRLFTYAANTTTPQATFANRAGTVANANPIILNARGEATVYLTPGIVYDYQFVSPDGSQVWTQENVIADAGDANSVAFLQSGAGAVQRSVLDKLKETVSVTDYGAVGNGVADDLPAFTKALTYLQSIGGGRLYLPKGTYNVSDEINIGNLDNLWIDGCGQDNTIVRTTSPTKAVFASNADRKYRKFTNFTVSSTVTKTAGAAFYCLMERRSIFSDLKIEKHFNGIELPGFEETELNRVKVVNPTGAGASVVAGTVGVFGSGANLHITACFFRGGDDLAAGTPVGSCAIRCGDIDALYMLDVDIGGFLDSDMIVNASVRAANFHVTSCYFDATKNSHCIVVQGAGTKQQWSFANCWISSAGQLTGGANDACGLFLADQGSYASIMFTGCRFYSNKASGAYQGKAGSLQFTGCNFESNGAGGSGNQYGFKYAPSAAVSPGPLITGCYFTGNTPRGAQTTALAREAVFSGCVFDNGVSISDSTSVLVNSWDKSAITYASATTVSVSPCHGYAIVTGTTNIASISATFVGHNLTMKFNGALTVIDGSGNLHLTSNFTTAAGSTITLICDGAEWWEVGRANT